MFGPGFLNLAKLFLPDMTWRVKDSSEVYLTIDDGPTPGITEWILEELRSRNIRATFFCLGKNIEMYPELFQLILNAGHKMGNHSYSHMKGWDTPTAMYLDDIDMANDLVRSDLYRPPYGRITKVQARILSERYRLVMGDVVSQDYSSRITPRQCLRNVTSRVKPGSIIVFHDSLRSVENMSYALPRSLDYILESGMEFGTLEFDREYPQLIPIPQPVKIK